MKIEQIGDYLTYIEKCTFDELCRTADELMYEIKKNGKKGFKIVDLDFIRNSTSQYINSANNHETVQWVNYKESPNQIPTGLVGAFLF